MKFAVRAVLSQQCASSSAWNGCAVVVPRCSRYVPVAGEVCAHDSKAGDTNSGLLCFQSCIYKDSAEGRLYIGISSLLGGITVPAGLSSVSFRIPAV